MVNQVRVSPEVRVVFPQGHPLSNSQEERRSLTFADISRGDDPATVSDQRIIELLANWFETDMPANMIVSRPSESQIMVRPRAVLG